MRTILALLLLAGQLSAEALLIRLQPRSIPSGYEPHDVVACFPDDHVFGTNEERPDGPFYIVVISDLPDGQCDVMTKEVDPSEEDTAEQKNMRREWAFNYAALNPTQIAEIETTGKTSAPWAQVQPTAGHKSMGQPRSNARTIQVLIPRISRPEHQIMFCGPDGYEFPSHPSLYVVTVTDFPAPEGGCRLIRDADSPDPQKRNLFLHTALSNEQQNDIITKRSTTVSWTLLNLARRNRALQNER